MTTVSLIGYVFAGAVTFSCVRHIAKGGLKEDVSVFSGRTWQDWVEVTCGDVVAIGAVIACAFLSQLGPKVLQWSWLSMFATKGDANQGSNQMIAGATIPYFGILFVLLLFVNLPRLAAAEEYSYREGTKNWLHAIPRSLTFGMMHMIVGVPLWCGLALSIPGMWFTGQYFKGGISRSTMAHALYNMIVATGLFVYIVALTFAK